MQTFIVTIIMQEDEDGVSVSVGMDTTINTYEVFGRERCTAFYGSLVPKIEASIRETLTVERETNNAG